jgi:aminoglycoside phosphotransferase (APT) family kinase protein
MMISESVPTEENALRLQLRELLRHALGSPVELVDFKIGNQHHDYLVLLVKLRQPSIKVVVKLAGREAPIACPFDRTAVLHRLVAAQTNIPMPEVLAVDVSYQTVPWRYFIKRHIPGQEWAKVRHHMDRQELAAAYQQMGEAVAQLHAIRFPSFGELSAEGTIPDDISYMTALIKRAQHLIQNERLRDLFLSVLDSRADLFVDIQTSSLCHEDLHGHNILFRLEERHWRLATILDFDKAWAGHNESDLARLEIWKGMLGKEFWWAYEKIHQIEPLYLQRRPIYQLLWCLEYAQPTAEHLADTQRVCAELGLAAVERF